MNTYKPITIIILTVNIHLKELVPFLTHFNSINQNEVNISIFLLKKELATIRRSTFTDSPEAHLSWKSTFNDVMNEIVTSLSEELNLLV